MKKVIVSAIVIFAVGIGLSFGYGIVNLASFIEDGVKGKFAVKEIDFGLGGPEPEVSEGSVEFDLGVNAIGKGSGKSNYFLREGVGPLIRPSLTARSFYVADIDTGEEIISRDEDAVYPIASLTKLMTAVISEENLTPTDETVITVFAEETYGGQGRLRRSQVFTIEELIYPLLLESSNDASEALAGHEDRNEFLALMNEKATVIGLENTTYRDPSGLTELNRSTAVDLFRLAKYIRDFRSYIFDITKLENHTERGVTWYNNSDFRKDENYLGGKNGYIHEARNTIVALFAMPLGENEEIRNVAIILLQSDAPERDTRRIETFLAKYVEYRGE